MSCCRLFQGIQTFKWVKIPHETCQFTLAVFRLKLFTFDKTFRDTHRTCLHNCQKSLQLWPVRSQRKRGECGERHIPRNYDDRRVGPLLLMLTYCNTTSHGFLWFSPFLLYPQHAFHFVNMTVECESSEGKEGDARGLGLWRSCITG